MTDAQPDALTQGLPAEQAATVLKLADAMLRGAIWWGVGVAVLGAVISGLVYGGHGVFGALVGGVVGIVSGVLTLVLMRSTSRVPVSMLMGIALMGFIGKTILLLIVMMSLKNVTALHPKALAYTMLATIVVWTAAETRAFARTKVPTIIPAVDNPN
ncbi:hypothetical protein D5S17_34565 [Pseudonocardiaceae bacterium YIM PH 21723]|nr:hypothetical protein D5S17_34565 [Pseudonocardiaceae bacterium YIM PH 21723]